MLNEKDAKKVVGDNVRKLRGDRSMSQLARECTALTNGTWTCYPATIQDIEEGQHKTNFWHLAIVAEALGVTLDEIYPIKKTPGRH